MLKYFLQGVGVLILSSALMAQAQDFKPLSSEVKIYNGRAVIMLNGQPNYPAIYALTDVPGGRWSWEELPAYNMRNFCERKFKFVQVDISFDHIWKEDGSVSIDTTQRQLRGVLNVCPDAAIFIRLHVNPPKWWQQKYTSEKTLYADTDPKPDYTWGVQRYIEDDEETPDRTSLASEKWKEEATEKLKEFFRKLRAITESNALAGIQVAGGVYGEWHYWGFINNEPDISVPMQEYFKNWLKDKYKTDAKLKLAWNDKSATFETAAVPLLKDRGTTTGGIFRDPSKERRVIDYYESQHICVAEDIIYFCKLVKESWPRPIITGAFYGYFYAVFGREAAGGHLELQKVLNSPYIDFLCGPGTYYPSAVEMGDPYRSRSLINSVLLHGKLWLDEMDQQPPLLPLKDSSFNESVTKSIANVRRNVMFTFSKGAGLWFYDFGPSGFNGGKRLADHGSWGWWDEPSLMQDISSLKKLVDEKMNEPFNSDADVLLVHDTKSFYYTGSGKEQSYMSHWADNWIPPAIFKSGVVHDVIHIDDLDKINASQYKAVVFVNTWVMNDAQKKVIREKIARGNRHLIFLYAPGYSNEKQLDENFISGITGIKVEKILADSPTTMLLAQSIPGSKMHAVFNNKIDPLFAVKDKSAITLGYSPGTSQVLFARKDLPTFTSWFIAVPTSDPPIWRYIFQKANAHIYDASEDIHYSGGGILTIHTAKGGKREIILKNGNTIKKDLPSNSTTLLNAETGESLLF